MEFVGIDLGEDEVTIFLEMLRREVVKIMMIPKERFPKEVK